MKYSLRGQSDKVNRKNFKNSRNKVHRHLQPLIMCFFTLQSGNHPGFNSYQKLLKFLVRGQRMLMGSGLSLTDLSFYQFIV